MNKAIARKMTHDPYNIPLKAFYSLKDQELFSNTSNCTNDLNLKSEALFASN